MQVNKFRAVKNIDDAHLMVQGTEIKDIDNNNVIDKNDLTATQTNDPVFMENFYRMTGPDKKIDIMEAAYLAPLFNCKDVKSLTKLMDRVLTEDERNMEEKRPLFLSSQASFALDHPEKATFRITFRKGCSHKILHENYGHFKNILHLINNLSVEQRDLLKKENEIVLGRYFLAGPNRAFQTDILINKGNVFLFYSSFLNREERYSYVNQNSRLHGLHEANIKLSRDPNKIPIIDRYLNDYEFGYSILANMLYKMLYTKEFSSGHVLEIPAKTLYLDEIKAEYNNVMGLDVNDTADEYNYSDLQRAIKNLLDDPTK